MDRLLNRLFVLNKHLRYRSHLLAAPNNPLVSALKRDKHYRSPFNNWTATATASNRKPEHQSEFDDPTLNLTRTLGSDRNFSSGYILNGSRKNTYNSSKQASYSSAKHAKNQSRGKPSQQPNLSLNDIKPLPVNPNLTQDNGSSVGKELTGELNKSE